MPFQLTELACLFGGMRIRALRGALIFTHFWGFRKFRGALIFFKNLAEILGSVYLHEFWWGALIFTFFLLILVRICTVKPLFCKNFPAARAKFLGSVYFRIFSRSAYYFHFSAFRKFWRALIILRKSSEMTLERLLRGGVIICNTLVTLSMKSSFSINYGPKPINSKYEIFILN